VNILPSIALLWMIQAPPESAAPHPAAFPRDYVLEWQAPPSCPSVAAIHARVADLMQRPAAGEGTAEVSVFVEKTEQGFGASVTTTFAGMRDDRQFRAVSCEELAEATAVLLAITLDPSLSEAIPDPPDRAVRETVPPPPAPLVIPTPTARPTGGAESPSPPPPESLIDESPPASSPKPRGTTKRPAEILLGIQGGMDYGGLSVATGAIRASLGLAWKQARLDVQGTYLTPRLLVEADGMGVLYQLGTAGLRGCWCKRFSPRWTLLPCGGAEAGVLRIDTRGIAPPQTHHRLFVGVVASLGVVARWSNFGLHGAVEFVGRVRGTRTFVDDDATHTQFPVSFRVLVGFEVALP